MEESEITHLILDFDQTMSAFHVHNTLGFRDPVFVNGEALYTVKGPTKTEINSLVEDQTLPKNGALLAALLKEAIKKDGLDVTIASFTHHSYLFKPFLEYIGLTPDEIDQIKIVDGYPNNVIDRAQSVDPKSETAQLPKEDTTGEYYAKDEHIKSIVDESEYENTLLIEDSSRNIDHAEENDIETVQVPKRYDQLELDDYEIPDYLSDTAEALGFGDEIFDSVLDQVTQFGESPETVEIDRLQSEKTEVSKSAKSNIKENYQDVIDFIDNQMSDWERDEYDDNAFEMIEDIYFGRLKTLNNEGKLDNDEALADAINQAASYKNPPPDFNNKIREMFKINLARDQEISRLNNQIDELEENIEEPPEILTQLLNDFYLTEEDMASLQNDDGSINIERVEKFIEHKNEQFVNSTMQNLQQQEAREEEILQQQPDEVLNRIDAKVKEYAQDVKKLEDEINEINEKVDSIKRDHDEIYRDIVENAGTDGRSLTQLYDGKLNEDDPGYYRDVVKKFQNSNVGLEYFDFGGGGNITPSEEDAALREQFEKAVEVKEKELQEQDQGLQQEQKPGKTLKNIDKKVDKEISETSKPIRELHVRINKKNDYISDFKERASDIKARAKALTSTKNVEETTKVTESRVPESLKSAGSEQRRKEKSEKPSNTTTQSFKR